MIQMPYNTREYALNEICTCRPLKIASLFVIASLATYSHEPPLPNVSQTNSGQTCVANAHGCQEAAEKSRG